MTVIPKGSTFIWHLRETQALANWAKNREPALVTSKAVNDYLDHQHQTAWTELLREAAQDYQLETAGLENPSDQFIDWLAEWSQETRRRQQGLMLLTAHRAKGLEFDHVIVLDGSWDKLGRGEHRDAQRRLYYVAMTRAKKTLTLCRFPDPHPLQKDLPKDSTVLRTYPLTNTPQPPELLRRYVRPGLKSIFLSYPGYRPQGDALHHYIASLSPGDPLTFQYERDRWELRNTDDKVVGLMAKTFRPPEGMKCISAQVSAICVWDKQRSGNPSTTEDYTKGLKADRWEVVIPTLVFEPDQSRSQPLQASKHPRNYSPNPE